MTPETEHALMLAALIKIAELKHHHDCWITIGDRAVEIAEITLSKI